MKDLMQIVASYKEKYGEQVVSNTLFRQHLKYCGDVTENDIDIETIFVYEVAVSEEEKKEIAEKLNSLSDFEGIELEHYFYSKSVVTKNGWLQQLIKDAELCGKANFIEK